MTFTNTDCVENDLCPHQILVVWREVVYQVNVHFCGQVTSQVYKPINPIQNTISKEIRK